MKSLLFLVMSVMVFAVVAPGLVEKHLSSTPNPKIARVETDIPRTAIGYRNRSGQFDFNASMNGRHVVVLVDTGASSVAINRSTARRIGISLNDDDFRYTAETANGPAKFARATIDEIRINGVLIDNVPAAVMKDDALNTTLLGMSFLNRLRKFEFNGNQLKLIQ